MQQPKVSMALHQNPACPDCSGRNRLSSIGIGIAAGLAAAASLIVSRKAVAALKVGQGHMAASIVQHKYPLDANSVKHRALD